MKLRNPTSMFSNYNFSFVVPFRKPCSDPVSIEKDTLSQLNKTTENNNKNRLHTKNMMNDFDETGPCSSENLFLLFFT